VAAVPEGQTFTADVRTRIEPAMAEGGPHGAWRGSCGGNVGDEVFESIDPTVRERVLNNGALFFSIELPALSRFVPDRGRMRASRGAADRGGG
jgi:hypothetical protein